MVVLSMLVSAISVAAMGQETTLKKLIEQAAAEDQGMQSSPGFQRLESDWIGDVTDDYGNVNKMRLEYGAIQDDKVTLARMFNNRFAGSDAPIFIEKLPKGDDLKSLRTLKELEDHFGESQGFTSGWGDRKRMHWTVGWTYVTKENERHLRYLSVFAHVSQSETQREEPAVVDKLIFSEGLLRPADPISSKEKIEYPTGEALFLAEQKKKIKGREQYPIPLRQLIEANEHPDDSDLMHYKRHLNSIRKNPDPKLFHQLLSVIDEGTLARRSNLEAILVDSWLELEPWSDSNRKEAMTACIKGLPLVKDSAKSDLMVILLKANGGGVIELGNRRIKVTVNDEGWSARHGSASDTVPLEETQRRLEDMLIKE